MLNKLAVRNAKRSVKDYVIYLFTVAFSLSLVYAFNLIVFTDEIKSISSGMSAMTGIIIGISCIIVLVIGWLICYMTKFILEKRSREFGTYLLLGIPNQSIASLFIRENLLMGGAACLASILLGSVIYQVLAMIIMKIFHASYVIKFQFSLAAVALTAGYAGIIYLFAMLRVRKKLRKVQIYDLLYAEKRNETAALKTGKGRGGLFFLSVAVGLAGCILFGFICHNSEDIHNGGLLFLAAILGIIGGIYGIYMTMTSFISGTILSHTTYKYKNQRLFLLRNLTARMRTMGVTLGTLALLLTLTLTSASMGLLFENFFTEKMENAMFFDITASSEESLEELEPVTEYARKNLGIREQYTYPIYRLEDRKIAAWLEEKELSPGWMEFTPVMAYGDYCRLRQMLGYQPVQIQKNKYILQSTRPIKEAAGMGGMVPLEVKGNTLTLQEGRVEPFGVSEGFNGTGYVVILADELAKQLPVFHQALVMQTVKETTSEDMNQMTELLMDGFRYGGVDDIRTKGYTQDTYLSVFTILAFSLYYIGLIFVCVAATVLTVHQLSEAVKYRFRYQIISKLGVGETALKKLIFQQILVSFGIPLVIPLPLSIFLSRQLSRWILMNEISNATFLRAIGISLGLFGFVYLLYFGVTYLGYKRSILRDS